MKGGLKADDLQGVVTPVTHTTGSALDVHITRNAGKYRASTHTIAGNFSVHSISMVESDLQVNVVTATAERTTGHVLPNIK